MLEHRNLIPCILQLIVIISNFLSAPHIFLFENNNIFFHYFFGRSQLMVHQFKLIKILFTIYQFVKSILERVTSFFLSNMLQLLNKVVCFFKLFSLIFDFSIVLLILFKNHRLFLFHHLFLLQNYFSNSGFNSRFHLLNLVLFILFRFI